MNTFVVCKGVNHNIVTFHTLTKLQKTLLLHAYAKITNDNRYK